MCIRDSLEGLGLPVGAISKLELRIVYLTEHAAPTDYTMPDVIDVEVHFGADIPPKLMQVPIERASKKKPFLGGFRSKKTGAEVHLDVDHVRHCVVCGLRVLLQVDDAELELRDRAHRQPERLEALCAAELGPLRLRRALAEEPVSYTHLTLPTIYSV